MRLHDLKARYVAAWLPEERAEMLAGTAQSMCGGLSVAPPLRSP
jgi:hypothetical protein